LGASNITKYPDGLNRFSPSVHTRQLIHNSKGKGACQFPRRVVCSSPIPSWRWTYSEEIAKEWRYAGCYREQHTSWCCRRAWTRSRPPSNNSAPRAKSKAWTFQPHVPVSSGFARSVDPC